MSRILVLLLLLLLATSSARAEDLWISFGGISHHARPEAGDNERNFGIGFQAGLPPTTRLVAQSFRNTHRVDSTLIGVAWHPWDVYSGEWGRVRPWVLAASITGYKIDAMWAALPGVSWEGRRVGVDLLLARERDDGGMVYALNFKVKW